MYRSPRIAVCLAALATTALCACTESVERVRPIPIGAAVTAEVANTPPVVESVAIVPIQPSGEGYACVPIARDAEGDPIEFHYRWHIDDVAAGKGDTLEGPFLPGQVVGCTVIPRDGRATGDAVASRSIVIEGPRAVAVQLAIEPEVAASDAPLRCGVIDGAGAPAVEWLVNGVRLRDAHGVTLPAERTRAGDRVHCRVQLGAGADRVTLTSPQRLIGALGEIAHATSLPTGP